jgi:ATP synthase protein I
VVTFAVAKCAVRGHRCYARVVVDTDSHIGSDLGTSGDTCASDDSIAWTFLAYLFTGPLLYGGLGWAMDSWLGTGWCTPVGIALGMVAAIYLIVIRYVRS